jgi:hypothetical protein
VLLELLPAECPRVDLRPRLVEPAVGAAVEVQLAVVDVARLDVQVDVGVVGVLVHGRDRAGIGELALEVLVGQVTRLVRLDLPLERQHPPVVRPRLAPAAARPLELVGLLLLGVLLQPVAQVAVVLGLAHLRGVVAGRNRVAVPAGRPAAGKSPAGAETIKPLVLAINQGR